MAHTSSMPKRSRKKPAKNFNQVARSIVDQATGVAPKKKPAPNKAKPPRSAKKWDVQDIERADSAGMAQPQGIPSKKRPAKKPGAKRKLAHYQGRSSGEPAERCADPAAIHAVCRAARFGLSFKSPSRTRLSAVATMASSLERGAQPSTRLAFSFVRVLALAELGQDLLHRRIAQRRDAHQPVGQLPGRHAPGGRAHAALQHLGDVEHRHEVAGDGEEALALGRRIGHGAQVQVGDVAHVDHAEREPRAAGHGAVHQALHEQDRGRIVGSEHRAKHAHRIDDRQLERAAFAGR